MYYARGGDSLNGSARGEGNAVLIKSAYPFSDSLSPAAGQRMMVVNNPIKSGSAMPRARPLELLCAGQTLLCRPLGLRVTDWDQQQVDPVRLYFDDVGYTPSDPCSASAWGSPPSVTDPYRA